MVESSDSSNMMKKGVKNKTQNTQTETESSTKNFQKTSRKKGPKGIKSHVGRAGTG